MKHLSFVLVVVMVTSLFLPSMSDCGDQLIWSVNGNTLTITGSGPMYNFTDSYVLPWKDSVQRIVKVIIYDGVTSIGDRAFYNIRSLAEISIPESVTYIGVWAFWRCDNLKKIDIPNSVTSIADNCFYESGLEEVSIPDGVKSIGESSFYSCRSLREVIIPDSVESIKKSAFHFCNTMTRVTIGTGVRSIENSAFQLCEGLRTVIYLGTEDFSSGSQDVFGFTPLESVHVLPDYNYLSFLGLTVEKSLTICGSNLTCSLSGEQLTINGTGTMINFSARDPPWRDQKNSIKTILVKEGVESISDNAFSGCPVLSSVDISSSVRSIGRGAFNDCPSLLTISVSNKNQQYSSVDGVLFDKNLNRLIRYPPGKQDPVYELKMPWDKSESIIEQYAFSGCNNLKGFRTHKMVNRINSYAFSNCSNLKTVILEDNVNIIEEYAFSGCKSLKGMVYLGSTAQNASNVFFECDSLKTVCTKKDIYLSPLFCDKQIEHDCGVCGNNLIWNANEEVLSIFGTGNMSDSDNSPNWPSSIKKIVIEDGVSSIGVNGFKDCKSITNVSIPGSVKSIGNHAFYDCSSLAQIVIPDGVPSIENAVFFGCGNLINVTIPDSVTSFGDYAFSGCSRLTQLTIPEGVCFLGRGVFRQCSSLTSVAIPAGVSSIKTDLFRDCVDLSRVIIPDSVTSIEQKAFFRCKSLAHIVIPNKVSSIGECAFFGCSSLISVSIPNAVQSIENGTFKECNSLVDVTIPENVTSIGPEAFCGCSSLTTVTIPDNVETIGASAFYGCSSLTAFFVGRNSQFSSIDGVLYANQPMNLLQYPSGRQSSRFFIPVGVEKVSMRAFYESKFLTHLVIPDSVQTIEYQAFQSCSNLSSVVYLGTKDVSSGVVFDNCSLRRVFVTSFYNDTSFCGLAASRTVLDNGLCGDNLGWFIDGTTSELAIFGRGEMHSFLSSEIPWFHHRDVIRTVFIDPGVTSILTSALNECDNISSIVVDEMNRNFSSIDGVLFSKDEKVLVRFPPAKESDSFAIGKSITSISNGAFRGCKHLSSITTEEGHEVFLSDGGVLLRKIGDERQLVRYPPRKDAREYQIAETISTIDDFAFEGSSSLTSIYIPQSVVSIGKGAFKGCSYLSLITVEQSNKQYMTSRNVLFSFDGKHLVLYPAKTLSDSFMIPDQVEFIDPYAFYANAYLNSVTIPTNVTSIGEHAFSQCEFLSSVSIIHSTRDESHAVVIHTMAFEGCLSLPSIVIPQSVHTIESYTFLNCASLSSITIISDNITIGSNAFYNCHNLNSMYYLDEDEKIKCSAFQGCDSLMGITVLVSSSNGTLCGKRKLPLLTDGGMCGDGSSWLLEKSGKITINGNGRMHKYESVSCVPWFSYSSAVTALSIENGLTSISSFAFEGFHSLKSVEFPISVKTIELGAFFDCRSLESVTFHGSLEEIGQWAFASCWALSKVYYFGSTYIPPNEAFLNCSVTSIGVTTAYKMHTFCGISANETLENGVFCEGLAWVVDISEGTLTISGSGEIDSQYDSQNVPWINRTKVIKEIIFEQGDVTVSADVFGSCTSIVIQSSAIFDDYYRVTFNDEGKEVNWIVKKGESLLDCNNQYDDGSKESLVDYFTNYHVFDGSNAFVFLNQDGKKFYNDTVLTDDIELALCHMIQTEQEMVNKFYVKKGSPLGGDGSPLERYFSNYYRISDSKDDHITYDKNSVVTTDVNLTIKALCQMFEDMKLCQNTTTCRWNEKNSFCTDEDESNGGSDHVLAIALGVVGGVLIIAALVIIAVVVVRKQQKKTLDQLELEALGNHVDMIQVMIKGKQTKLKFVSKIGKGSFATVWRAESVEDHSVYAVKVVESLLDEAVKDAQKEAVMLKELDSNYVVGVYDCYQEKDIMAIVMDYFELGSLETVIKNQPLSINVGVAMLYHISRAMEYLHGRNIIHRDLKPGNVLVCSLDPSSPTMCKISDFGEARGVETMEKSMTMTSGLGTPFYMAPEMMNNSKHYSSAIDVYSFGIMAAEITVGKLSFGDDLVFDTPYAFVMMVLQGLRPRLNANCPLSLQSLIQKCWDGTPSNRPSFTVILGELNKIIQSNEVSLDPIV